MIAAYLYVALILYIFLQVIIEQNNKFKDLEDD